ncbi:restriction endonuclease subunit S [uncultured Paraprevotella sp.]|uniref:restriction endonuclease subunit S n=1 Tax=uncultured Paraprevotella sp. TaxID=910951 RepID=UPI00259B80D5|nr:restriction endonuclease subunit S [uncultured Paraprevotella sp.]
MKCIDEEIPFDIPQGWEWCRLKHMCSMQAGKNISASEIYDEKSVLHPYRCVGGNGLRGFTNTFNAEGHFAIIGRQGALCGCLNIESGKFYATEHAVVVNGFGIISSLFIYYFFTALNLNQYATATAQPGLAVSNIAEVFIPLPPLPEQLRIVSKIEKLLPLVKTYKQAQNELNTLNATLNEQLRKSILQEAIQGKLVPQIAEEGTAEKLLAEIRKEKESLVKEGKLKKSALSDSIIYKGADNKYFEKIGKTVKEATDEIPFEIPTTWQWVRIKDIFQINPKNIAEENCISAFIPMEKICATYGSEFSYDEVQWKAIKAGYTHFADGDVAFAKITPCFQNRKSAIFCNLPNGIGAGTTELKVLRQFGETINRWYLLFFLESPYFIDEAIFKGTANQQRIISGYLENKLFPLPPLQEQTRIEKQIKAIASIMRG